MNFKNFDVIYGGAKFVRDFLMKIRRFVPKKMRGKFNEAINRLNDIMDVVLRQFCSFFPDSCEKAESLPMFDYKYFFSLASKYPEAFEKNGAKFEELKMDMFEKKREIPK